MKGKRAEGAEKRSRTFLRSAWSKMELLRKKDRRAFTLAEVLIVVAIIATLTAVAIPVFRGQLEKNRDSVTVTNLRAAYDEATAIFLANGKKLSDDPVKVKVDGVVFETTDKSLSGEEKNLPFTFDLDEIEPKKTRTVEFSFQKGQTTMTMTGESGTAIEGFPDVPTVNDPEVVTLTGITISGTPKKAYYVGESFSKAGMTVTANYSKSEYDHSVTGFSVSPSGPYTASGEVIVTVSYTEGGVTVRAPLDNMGSKITVSKPTLTGIEISGSPKTDYHVEESFSPAGMVVTAKYSDESEAAVLGYSCMPSGPYTASGEVEVTVSYTEGDVTMTDKLDITVKKTLDSITIEDVKTEYDPGEFLDLSNMKVWAHYKGSDPDEDVTAQAITERPAEPLEPGKHQLKVSYTEDGKTKTATLEITVGKAIREIAITTPPTKLVYVEGERFDPTDMVVTVTYIDDTFDTIEDTNVFTYTPAGRLTADVENVKVVYKYGDENWEMEQPITVKAIEKIEIKIDGETVVLYVCDAGDFDLTELLEKMTLVVTYTDGSISDPPITKTDFDLGPTELNAKPPKAGEYTLTVAYPKDAGEDAKTATQNVKITRELVSITSVRIPNPYRDGDEFDPSNMAGTVLYTDGPEDVTGFTVDPAALSPSPVDGKLKEGTIYTVPISYTNPDDDTDTVTGEATFTVGEALLHYIEITTPPQNTQLAGYEFDRTGMVVTAVYTNLTSKPLNASDYTIVAPTGVLQNVGACEVTVSYTEGAGEDAITRTAKCTVTVKSIDHLEIENVESTYDAKYFKENHEAIRSSAVVKAVYNDGTSESVTPDSDPSFSGDIGTPKEGDQYTLTATYKGANATHTITITKKPESIEISGVADDYQCDSEDFVLSAITSAMVVKVRYSDGSLSDPIPSKDYNLDIPSELQKEQPERPKASDYTLKVSYPKNAGDDAMEATLTVKITKHLTGIKITTPPTKVKYKAGDTFNPAGMVVEALYSDNIPVRIENYSYPTTALTESDFEVTISYTETEGGEPKTAKQTIGVITGISIITEPQKNYTAGQKYNPAGLVVRADYSDGSWENVSYDSNQTKFSFYPDTNTSLTTSHTSVTITYEGKPTTQTITVTDGGCFAPGTLITLADGTQKPVEELSFDDELLVWDFSTGTYDAQPAVLLINHGEGTYPVIDLSFSDGTLLSIVEKHGIFDYDLNRFVYVDPKNAEDYIGHRFVKCAPEGGYDLVTLDSVEVSEEQITALSVVSSYDFNVFASDLLTMTPSPVEGSFDLMPMGETLRYDMDQFQKNVAEYGTYDYEVFAQYVTEEQFEAVNGAFMKILVESGVLSFEELCKLAVFFTDFMN